MSDKWDDLCNCGHERRAHGGTDWETDEDYDNCVECLCPVFTEPAKADA